MAAFRSAAYVARTKLEPLCIQCFFLIAVHICKNE